MPCKRSRRDPTYEADWSHAIRPLKILAEIGFVVATVFHFRPTHAWASRVLRVDPSDMRVWTHESSS